jgi:transposase
MTGAVAWMTNHVVRLYTAAASLLLLLLAWAAIAAHPWAAAPRPTADPRVTALVAREQRLRHDAVLVRRIVDRRWAVYRSQLRKRQAQIASANQAAQLAAATPSVRVVTLPPLTITRTS